MTLWTEDTEQRADMAHWLGHGRWAGPQGDARWRAMGLRHVLMLCETAAEMEWKAGEGRAVWPPVRMLDYGCGGGANIVAASAVAEEFTLADVSKASMVEALSALRGSTSDRADNRVLRFEDGIGVEGLRHDAALCTAVLQHVDHDEARAILRTIQGVMAPGGVALISTRRPQPGDVPGDVCALTAWAADEAAVELDRAGFRVVRQWTEGSQDYWGCERV